MQNCKVTCNRPCNERNNFIHSRRNEGKRPINQRVLETFSELSHPIHSQKIIKRAAKKTFRKRCYYLLHVHKRHKNQYVICWVIKIYKELVVMGMEAGFAWVSEIKS